MKYFITEKTDILVIFIEVHNIQSISLIADMIDNDYPGSVLEITHNIIARQGSIILKKESIEYIEEIKKILNT